MTCRSCEVRVTRRLQGLDGVTRASVSARTGVAEITSRRTVPRPDLVRAIERAGYSLADENGRRATPWLSRDRKVWRDLTLAVALVASVAWLLTTDRFGVVDPTRFVGSQGGTGVLVVLGLGVAAGFSTCLALVGGLVVAVSATFNARHPDATIAARLRPQVVFNLGRIVGFTVLGAVLGLIGSAVTLSGPALAIAMISVAVVMGFLGVQLTQFSPRLAARPGFSLPSGLAVRLRLDQAGSSYSDLRAAAMGAGSFLLPCGFTQAVQLFALSTGDPLRAGAVMGLFALGTAPGLLAVGGITAAARGRFAETFRRFAGVVVLGFAAINVSGALAVLAPGLLPTWAGSGPAATSATAISSNVRVEADHQVLSTVQDLDGYSPAASTVVLGKPVRWEVNSASMGCASYLDAHELGLDPVMLDYGPNTLTFTPTRTGTFHYSCVMGMYRGTITVIDDPARGSAST
jgi:sulfite exporter TauE/SafE/copper chaperone CopZ